VEFFFGSVRCISSAIMAEAEQASAGLPQRQDECRLVPFIALANVVS
jgi:hypothetical protein